jgi:hypothetical protein
VVITQDSDALTVIHFPETQVRTLVTPFCSKKSRLSGFFSSVWTFYSRG